MKVGRITKENKTNYIITHGDIDLIAVVRGAFYLENTQPKVGDYVVFTEVSNGKAVIDKILPRKSAITRKSSHTIKPQTIVANVDTMFIVMGLDADFNLNRLERYILLAEQSKILPILLLNKCDVVDDVTEYMLLTSQRFPTVTNHVISAVTGYNMEILYKYLPKGTTVVLLGSSGAGKSTITNWLLNHKQQEVRNVREDDSHGRHTTTSRQLFLLPCGAYLIDTPGIRELGLLGEVEGDTFLDIELIANKCQFTKCDHVKTKGCAVVEAVTSGIISQKQIDNFFKLKREKAFIDSKTDQKLSWKKKQDSRKTQKKRKKILTQRYSEKGLL